MRALALWVVCVSVVAHAQPAPDAPPAPDVAPPADVAAPAPDRVPPVGGPSTSVDPRIDAGWQLYHEAFAKLLVGKRRRAAQLVGQLQRDYPGHPAATLTARSGLVAAPMISDVSGPPAEGPTSSARAELALFQTVHGIALGVELCLLAECDSGEAFILLALVGGGVGAGVSLSRANLTSGQRALINSGTLWGAANAGLLMIAAQPDSYKTAVLSIMAGQLGGLALGASLYSYHPTSGQVGLANSGGQWALALTGLTLAALQPDGLDEKDVSLILLAAMDGGLGVGAYLAKNYPRISRGRGWVIDAAGIVGGVGGAGAGVLVSGSADERATPALAAVGAVAGLGLGSYLTRHWDEPTDDDDSTIVPVVMPARRGRGGTAGIAFSW